MFEAQQQIDEKEGGKNNWGRKFTGKNRNRKAKCVEWDRRTEFEDRLTEVQDRGNQETEKNMMLMELTGILNQKDEVLGKKESMIESLEWKLKGVEIKECVAVGGIESENWADGIQRTNNQTKDQL